MFVYLALTPGYVPAAYVKSFSPAEKIYLLQLQLRHQLLLKIKVTLEQGIDPAPSTRSNLTMSFTMIIVFFVGIAAWGRVMSESDGTNLYSERDLYIWE